MFERIDIRNEVIDNDLPEKFQRLLVKIQKIQHDKGKAVKDNQYEQAAQLRDLEKKFWDKLNDEARDSQINKGE